MIYPKMIMAVRPMVGFHHNRCLASPEFAFFSIWLPTRPCFSYFPSQAAETSDGPWPHCSSSVLLSLSAGLEVHLEPWSHAKILKFFPNRICRWEQRGVALHEALHCKPKLQLIFPMGRKSNYPVFLKEVQTINF